MIYHTMQQETSHFAPALPTGKAWLMDASIAFRENLLRLMGEQKLRAAELSKRAGLNPRAVKDIEENRVVSPKLSTVIALAEALGADPAEMMGLGARDAIKPELARFLSQYTEEEQGRILTALAAFPSAKP